MKILTTSKSKIIKPKLSLPRGQFLVINQDMKRREEIGQARGNLNATLKDVKKWPRLDRENRKIRINQIYITIEFVVNFHLHLRFVTVFANVIYDLSWIFYFEGNNILYFLLGCN